MGYEELESVFVDDSLSNWGKAFVDQWREAEYIKDNSPLAHQQYLLDQTNAFYDPYRQAAEKGWGDYTAMTTGEGSYNDVPMSPQYNMEMDRNTTGVNRMLAAKGLINSSARGAALGDVALSAGQNEAARQYGKQLDIQKIGTGALAGLSGAGNAATSNVSGLYSNMGQNANMQAQNEGLQSQQNWNMFGNAMTGLGQYYG